MTSSKMPETTLVAERLAFRRGYLDAMDRGRKSTQKTDYLKAYENGFRSGSLEAERIIAKLRGL